MLGHPADAEDAAQEILVVVLTHLGSFRRESALWTWVLRIAANHLLRARRGRREALGFELLGERLDRSLGDAPQLPDPEVEAMALEVRLRCTEAMLLCLDRQLRIAFILGEIFGLSGEEAAQVLDLDATTWRKRLSRARRLVLGFMRQRCGVFDPAKPCRCRGQVGAALADGRLDPGELSLARHPVREPAAGPAAGPRGEVSAVQTGAREVGALLRVAEVMRGHPEYAASDRLLQHVRALLDAGRLELLRE